MKEFKVVLSGERSDKSFYLLIEKEDENGFTMKAFLKCNKLHEKGATVSLPEKLIPWTY